MFSSFCCGLFPIVNVTESALAVVTEKAMMATTVRSEAAIFSTRNGLNLPGSLIGSGKNEVMVVQNLGDETFNMSSRFHHNRALAYHREGYWLCLCETLAIEVESNWENGKKEALMQIVVVCSNCKAKNRVDEARLTNSEAKCGRCGAKLEGVAEQGSTP